MRVQRDVTSVDNDGAVESSQSRHAPTRPGGHSSNHVAPHEGHNSGSSPVPVANDETKSLRQRIQEETAARLADDPSYVDAQTALAAAQAVLSDFALVEMNSLCAADGKLTLADVRAVAEDPLRPDNVREAARRLLANAEVWASASKDGVTLSNQELVTFINAKKGELDTKRKEVEAQVREDLGAPPAKGAPDPAASSGQTPASTGKKEDPVAGEIEKSAPKPTPSTLGGMEGAYENANNLLGWAEGEMDRLNALLAKTDDPKLQKQIENKMNQLTRRMQSITAMITQLATMMSNISKMYSDIAMNSVRNMK